MKRFYTSLLAIFVGIVASYAQCVPDSSITEPGFYPSGTDLPCIRRGEAVDTAIQLLNFDSISVAGYDVVVNWVRIDGVSGLPAGITTSCTPGNCTFPASSYGCIGFTGSTNAQPGSYPLVINATVSVYLNGVPFQQSGTTSDLGYDFILEVVDSNSPCPPSTVTIPGPVYACPGSGAQLSPVIDQGGGSGPYTYSWSPTTDLSDPNIIDPVASPSIATTYTLTVTDPNSFSFTSTVEVLLDNTPVPVADFTDSVAGGNTVYFTDLSANGSTYSWDFGDGALSAQQNPSHTFSSLGDYTVSLIVSNNCGADTTTIDYSITSVTDIQISAIDLNVYPNPTFGIVNIATTDLAKGNYQIAVHDLTGKLVYATDRNANELINTSIDLTTLTKGMYFLSITGHDRKQVVKLMLDK